MLFRSPATFTPAVRNSIAAPKQLRKGQVVVRITEVLAPAYKLPLHEPGLTLGHLAAGAGGQFFILINVSALRTRSLSPPFEPPVPELNVNLEEVEFEDEEDGTKAGKGGQAARRRVLVEHPSEDEFSDADSLERESESESENDRSGDNKSETQDEDERGEAEQEAMEVRPVSLTSLRSGVLTFSSGRLRSP